MLTANQRIRVEWAHCDPAGIIFNPHYYIWMDSGTHALLQAAGFSLDLGHCAVTGVQERLAHVSPKSGRAVAEGAAGDFAGRMLVLPQFLGGVSCNRHDFDAGLSLTGHFLERRVFAAHHADIPPQRRRLFDMVSGLYGGTSL